MLNCPICVERYSEDKNTPMLIGMCGHTVCMYCISRIQETGDVQKCPSCRRCYNPRRVVPNYAIKDLLEELEKKERKPCGEQNIIEAYPVRVLRSGRHQDEDPQEQNMNIRSGDSIDAIQRGGTNLQRHYQVESPPVTLDREDRQQNDMDISSIVRGNVDGHRFERHRSRSRSARRGRNNRGQTESNSDQIQRMINTIENKKSVTVSRRDNGTLAMLRMSFFDR